MAKKLTKEELEKKRNTHENKAQYYQRKIDKLEVEEVKIGFKWYKQS